MVTISLVIPGVPVPKQSVRVSVNRFFQNGQHWCPWCKQQTWHNKGDVVVFRSKTSGNVDVMIQMYQDSKFARLNKAIRMIVQQQLPKGFKMFEKEVHVDFLDFVFPIITTLTKKQVKFIEEGGIIFKNTRPDMSDNLKKQLNDSLSGLVWKDDALIVEENKVRKRFGVEPKTIITLTGE